MNDDAFTLHLTAAELMCAAMALGLAEVPLPGNPQFHQLPADAPALITQGYDSLRQRGFLQPISAGQWQVDSLIAILTYWIASPDLTLQIDVWSRQEQQRQAAVYFWQEQPLWLLPTEDGYQLTLFRADGDWRRHCLDWLRCSTDQAVSDFTLQLPRLNLEKFLPLVWQQSEVVTPALARAGLSPEDAAHTIQSVQQAITLTWTQAQAKNPWHQALLLDTGNSVWGESGLAPEDEVVCLRPLRPEDLPKMLIPVPAL
ncbi:MAG: hypothetical protein HS099_28525 [Ardenticatenaceae bacterium]|nr:hypothetical protein [Ardenticatenaceae bacterium]